MDGGVALKVVQLAMLASRRPPLVREATAAGELQAFPADDDNARHGALLLRVEPGPSSELSTTAQPQRPSP